MNLSTAHITRHLWRPRLMWLMKVCCMIDCTHKRRWTPSAKWSLAIHMELQIRQPMLPPKQWCETNCPLPGYLQISCKFGMWIRCSCGCRNARMVAINHGWLVIKAYFVKFSIVGNTDIAKLWFKYFGKAFFFWQVSQQLSGGDRSAKYELDNQTKTLFITFGY